MKKNIDLQEATMRAMLNRTKIEEDVTPDREYQGIKYFDNQDGWCPICNAHLHYEPVEYGGQNENGDSVSYCSWTCDKCGTRGEAYFKQSFIGHSVYDDNWDLIDLPFGEPKTESNNNDEVQSLKDDIWEYITDDVHHLEDFADYEINSEEDNDKAHEIAKANLNKFSLGELREIAAEIASGSIDLVNWGHKVLESKKVEAIDKEKVLNMKYLDLPDMCYGLLPSDKSIIIIKKGENGYYETDFDDIEDTEEFVNRENSKMGVTPEQRMVMELRSMSGNWKLKTEAKRSPFDYRVVSLYGGKKIMLNKKHNTQEFQQAMRDAYKKIKGKIKDGDDEVDMVLANLDPSIDWLDLEDVNENKKVEDVEKLNNMYEQGTTELEKAFTTEVKYWLQALIDDNPNDAVGVQALNVIDNEAKIKEIVDELVNGSDDLWEEIHLKIEQLAGIDYKNSTRGKIESKQIKTESVEPEENKKLDLKDRVKYAYENCNYSKRKDMPTVSDIMDYLGLDTYNNKLYNQISDILYELGYDWKLESKQIKSNKKIKTENNKSTILEGNDISDDEGHIIWDSEISDDDFDMEQMKDLYKDYCTDLQGGEVPEFDDWFEDYKEDNYNVVWDWKEDDLKENILPEIDKQINENYLMLCGGYNSNYPDFKPSGSGGTDFEGIDGFRDYISNFDRVAITSTDGVLGAICDDHDGTVAGQFYTLPDDPKELIKALGIEERVKEDYADADWEDGVVGEYDSIGNYRHYDLEDLVEKEYNELITYGGLDVADFQQHLDLMKPIKDTISGYSNKVGNKKK